MRARHNAPHRALAFFQTLFGKWLLANNMAESARATAVWVTVVERLHATHPTALDEEEEAAEKMLLTAKARLRAHLRTRVHLLLALLTWPPEDIARYGARGRPTLREGRCTDAA